MELKSFDGFGPTLGLDIRQQVDDRIPQGRQHLRGGSRPHPARVLAHGHVADVVQSVLDLPVVAEEDQEGGRVRSLRRAARDPVHHLHRRLAPDCPLPRDAEPFPLRPHRQNRRRFQRPLLDPPVSLLDGRGDPLGRRRRGKIFGRKRPPRGIVRRLPRRTPPRISTSDPGWLPFTAKTQSPLASMTRSAKSRRQSIASLTTTSPSSGRIPSSSNAALCSLVLESPEPGPGPPGPRTRRRGVGPALRHPGLQGHLGMRYRGAPITQTRPKPQGGTRNGPVRATPGPFLYSRCGMPIRAFSISYWRLVLLESIRELMPLFAGVCVGSGTGLRASRHRVRGGGASRESCSSGPSLPPMPSSARSPCCGGGTCRPKRSSARPPTGTAGAPAPAPPAPARPP